MMDYLKNVIQMILVVGIFICSACTYSQQMQQNEQRDEYHPLKDGKQPLKGKMKFGYYFDRNDKKPIYVCDFVKFPPKDNKNDCIFYMRNEGLKSENYQQRLDQGDLLWIKPEAFDYQIYRQVSNTVVRTPLSYWQSLCRIKQDSGLYVGHVPYVKGTTCTATMPQNGQKIESKIYEVLVTKQRDQAIQLSEKINAK